MYDGRIHAFAEGVEAGGVVAVVLAVFCCLNHGFVVASTEETTWWGVGDGTVEGVRAGINHVFLISALVMEHCCWLAVVDAMRSLTLASSVEDASKT